MDIVMPMMEELDGLGALKEIVEFDPKANILIVSVMGQESLVKKAMEYGAKDFIFKPFKPERIIKAVREVLKKSAKK
jgi:two-component system chemotaxis response regulator CheY